MKIYYTLNAHNTTDSLHPCDVVIDFYIFPHKFRNSHPFLTWNKFSVSICYGWCLRLKEEECYVSWKSKVMGNCVLIWGKYMFNESKAHVTTRDSDVCEFKHHINDIL